MLFENYWYSIEYHIFYKGSLRMYDVIRFPNPLGNGKMDHFFILSSIMSFIKSILLTVYNMTMFKKFQFSMIWVTKSSLKWLILAKILIFRCNIYFDSKRPLNYLSNGIRHDPFWWLSISSVFGQWPENPQKPLKATPQSDQASKYVRRTVRG